MTDSKRMNRIGIWDERITQKVHSTFGNYTESRWWKALEFSGSQTGYAIVVIVQFLISVSPVQIVVQTVQIILITLVMMVVKPLVARERPPSPTPKEVAHYYDNFSFPSGHATRAGVIVAVSVLSGPLGSIFLFWGVFICVSRVAQLHHYMGDVLFGFLAGLVFSIFSHGFFTTMISMFV